MGTTTTVVEISSNNGGEWIQALSIFFAAVAGIAAAVAVVQGRSRERDQRLQAVAETIASIESGERPVSLYVRRDGVPSAYRADTHEMRGRLAVLLAGSTEPLPLARAILNFDRDETNAMADEDFPDRPEGWTAGWLAGARLNHVFVLAARLEAQAEMRRKRWGQRRRKLRPTGERIRAARDAMAAAEREHMTFREEIRREVRARPDPYEGETVEQRKRIETSEKKLQDAIGRVASDLAGASANL